MRIILLGALAGLAATMSMTATMRRMHRQLPDELRYPLPPRQIVDQTIPLDREEAARGATMLAHFGFGALSGALYTLPAMMRLGGAGYGLAVWAGSYLGWVPGLRILSPATRHPRERNLLMIAAHVVWGVTLAKCLEELSQSDEIFGRSTGERQRTAKRAEMEKGS
ncbi:hypothetical protein [Aminobacter sp. DSM 101952]|uniref:hypothetical protein n=1 Tax=Aminobacter sp. DSM 101952 TaxID=2735891 RepID=UPI0016145ECE|nr:hypothetical protein [Aminobacter sp. DSM 101952]